MTKESKASVGIIAVLALIAGTFVWFQFDGGSSRFGLMADDAVAPQAFQRPLLKAPAAATTSTAAKPVFKPIQQTRAETPAVFIPKQVDRELPKPLAGPAAFPPLKSAETNSPQPLAPIQRAPAQPAPEAHGLFADDARDATANPFAAQASPSAVQVVGPAQPSGLSPAPSNLESPEPLPSNPAPPTPVEDPFAVVEITQLSPLPISPLPKSPTEVTAAPDQTIEPNSGTPFSIEPVQPEAAPIQELTRTEEIPQQQQEIAHAPATLEFGSPISTAPAVSEPSPIEPGTFSNTERMTALKEPEPLDLDPLPPATAPSISPTPAFPPVQNQQPMNEPVFEPTPIQPAATQPAVTPPAFGSDPIQQPSIPQPSIQQPTFQEQGPLNTAPVPAEPAKPATVPEKVYTVQNGENFWSISRKHYGGGRFFAALAEYNKHRIPRPERMRPGMIVLVPDLQVLLDRYPKLSGAGEAKPIPSDGGQAGFFVDDNGQPSFRIGKGDTLGSIAQKHLGRSSRWIQIMGMNRDRIPNGNTLKIGTVLRLPADASQVALAPSAQ